jgi:hypothetical protein
MKSKSLVVAYEQALDRVLSSLERSRGTWPVIAESTGISYYTLTKIAQRTIDRPCVEHIQQLTDFFSSRKTA